MQIKFGRAAQANGGFGRFLKEVRELKNFGQEEVAKEIGITRSTLSLIECGKAKVTIQRAAMLFEVLGVNAFCEFDKCGGVRFRLFVDGIDSSINFDVWGE